MKLHDTLVSGNCYKVRLMLALLGRDYQCEEVDLPSGAQRRAEFLRLNPRGQVPVLVDGDTVLWDSQAILVYLARRYAAPQWLPEAPAAMARVMQWLAFAGNECLFGMARARAVNAFGRPWDLAECQRYSREGMAVLDAHLGERAWLAAEHPTIADIACYPYVALLPAGGVELEPYAAARAWIGRVQALPGYVGMPGIDAPG